MASPSPVPGGAVFTEQPAELVRRDAPALVGDRDRHIQPVALRRDPESIERYARRVEINEIEANDCNLNISRYVSTAEQEVEIDLSVTHKELVEIEKQIQELTAKHNAFLKELGLSPLPAPNK